MSAKKAPNKRLRKPASSKTTPEPRPSQGKLASGKPRSDARPKRALSPLEVQLRKALAEMGLARARRVFAAVEASFDD